MGSKHRAARDEQRLYWENRLSQRLALLTEKGLEPASIAKDPAVRKIRAQIRETAARLSAIDALEKKTAEMAKAEKADASKKETGKKKKRPPEEASEESKRQQKKKKKLEKKKENKADP